MEFEHFKRWQWILVGLFLGPIFGFLNTSIGTDFDSKTYQSLDLPQFEDLVLRNQFQGPAIAWKMKIYPMPDSKNDDLIVGGIVHYELEDPFKRQDPNTNKRKLVQQPFFFRLKTPYPKAYRGREALPKMDLSWTNAKYLEQLKATYPDATIDFRNAWWAIPKNAIMLWTAGTVIVIGGIWPRILSLLVGGGFGPKRPPKADKSRPYRASEEAVAKKRAEMSEADAAQLAALEAKLRANVADFLDEDRDDDVKTARPGALGVKKLTGAPLEASKTEEQKKEEQKQYAGQFYPTIAHAKKKDPDQKDP